MSGEEVGCRVPLYRKKNTYKAYIVNCNSSIMNYKGRHCAI